MILESASIAVALWRHLLAKLQEQAPAFQNHVVTLFGFAMYCHQLLWMPFLRPIVFGKCFIFCCDVIMLFPFIELLPDPTRLFHQPFFQFRDVFEQPRACDDGNPAAIFGSPARAQSEVFIQVCSMKEADQYPQERVWNLFA